MFWRKKVFSSAGDVVVDVRDIAAAQRWYCEKLGLSYSSPDVEEASMELGYSPDSIVAYLVEISGSQRPNKSPASAYRIHRTNRDLAKTPAHLSDRSDQTLHQTLGC